MRLLRQGIDTSTMDVFKSLKSVREESIEASNGIRVSNVRDKGMVGAQLISSPTSHSLSVIDDIYGNIRFSFNEACWIILTS